MKITYFIVLVFLAGEFKHSYEYLNHRPQYLFIFLKGLLDQIHAGGDSFGSEDVSSSSSVASSTLESSVCKFYRTFFLFKQSNFN